MFPELVVTTRDPDATRALAARLAAVARPGDVVTLLGELGAGKTVFAKGFAAGLGIRATVNSPSFVLMAEYDGRLPLFHLDLYRLADAADVVGGGLLDERQAAGVTLIEWAERLGEATPADRLQVAIAGRGDDPRRLTVRATGPRHRRYLGVLTEAGHAAAAARPSATADASR
jgi:tRNA threonylcarbamoyladenosine biosynthesis protein TsaE